MPIDVEGKTLFTPVKIVDPKIQEFNIRGRDRDASPEKPRLVYVVSYDFDRSSKRVSFICHAMANRGFGLKAIYHGHGIEGHWFQATDAWERFVSPIIAAAVDSLR